MPTFFAQGSPTTDLSRDDLQVAEEAEQEGPRLDAERLAVADGLGWAGQAGSGEQVRDFDDTGARGMLAHHCGGGWIVHDDGAGAFRNALEHGVIEVAAVARRGGALTPETGGEGPAPFPVVVDELFDVGRLVERAQAEMIPDGLLQTDDARGVERAGVDGGVERVVAEVIEGHIASGGGNFDGAVAAEFGQQGGGVIGDAGGRGRERRIKADAKVDRRKRLSHFGARGLAFLWGRRFRLPTFLTFSGHALILLPNKAVPMRTQVEPSSMAVSRSWDMPMESCGKPCNSPSARRRRKISRGASGSSDQGGMVIRPVRRRWGHWRTAAINSGRSAGRAPLLASSTESLTSSMMSSGRPASSRRRAILAESTVWMAWNSSAARRVLLDCRWPMKWKRAPGRLATSGALESNSWT